MASAADVAERVLDDLGETTTLQLQKILYYCQGCHLALHGTTLFDDSIEAWQHGPVIKSVFRRHKGRFKLRSSRRFPFFVQHKPSLTASEAELMEMVVEALRGFSADELEEATHVESPWVKAREGLSPKERSEREIPVAAIREFFTEALEPRGVEPDRDVHGNVVHHLYEVIAAQRSMSPTVARTENQVAEWNRLLDAPPKEVEGLSEFMAGRSVFV